MGDHSMWPTGMSIHCVYDRAGAPRDPSRSVRDDGNSVHLYTSGRFAELRSNGISVSFVDFLPDELAHTPCKFGSARLWICACTIQIRKGEVQHLGLPDNDAGAIPPGRVPLLLNTHYRYVPEKCRSRRAIFVPFLDGHFAWQMPRPIDSGSEICCAIANLATPKEEPT